MTHSPLATSSTAYAGKGTKRRSRIDMLIVHHTATTNLAAVQRMFGTTAYEVSANYIAADAELIAAVPEELRAFTSGDPSGRDGGKGAAFDHRAVTVETLNSAKGEPWPISEASHRTLVALAVDLHHRYGLPLDRDHIVGHGELHRRWGASVVTRCPGGIDLDRIVRDARAAVATPTTHNPKEDPMRVYANTKSGAWAVVGGFGFRPIREGAAAPLLRATGQTEPDRIPDAEFNALQRTFTG